MSEPFTFEVAYGTTIEQIEGLRTRMLEFVKEQRRDFISQFDISIQGITG